MGVFDGKVALITGAARGNGEGIARVIASKGGTVVLTDLSETVTDTAANIGGSAVGYKMDVCNPGEIKMVVDDVIAKFGHIDVLVNNAGITCITPFLETTDEIRDRTLRVLQLGVWNCTKAVIPHMLKAKYGRIVNISSVTGPVVCDPCEVAYSMAKASVMGFTRSIAVEYASSNITCNAVLPGYILTQMAIETAERTKPGHADEVIKSIESGIPMGRMGTPQDIGYLVAFLASDEASYITGIPVIIDGGNALPETNVVGDL